MSTMDYTAQGIDEPDPNAGPVDKRYLKGIPGIIKMVEALLSLIAFICATVSLCASGLAVKPYFSFTTMGAFIAILFMWLILLLKVHKRIFKCACVNWPFFEMMFYVVIIVFYFFAVLFMSIFACDAARKAACAFGWFAFAAFIADFVFALRVWLAARKAPLGDSTTITTTPVDSQPKY